MKPPASQSLSPMAVFTSSLSGDSSTNGRSPFTTWSLVVLLLIVLGAVVVGVEVHRAKVWLMDDFRHGYAAGTEVAPVEGDEFETCLQIAEDTYWEPSMSSGEPERAFTEGCWRAAASGNNDFWNVSDYLYD